jgi:hypothetical protein
VLKPCSSFDEDYGIVSRVWDITTERLVVTASAGWERKSLLEILRSHSR